MIVNSSESAAGTETARVSGGKTTTGQLFWFLHKIFNLYPLTFALTNYNRDLWVKNAFHVLISFSREIEHYGALWNPFYWFKHHIQGNCVCWNWILSGETTSVSQRGFTRTVMIIQNAFHPLDPPRLFIHTHAGKVILRPHPSVLLCP